MPRSLFESSPDILPKRLKQGLSLPELLDIMGGTCFEARNVSRAAHLFKTMIDQKDTLWLGIAGAGIAGGMGGMVISLMEAGFIDVICSTGAQVYHDLHFAFDLPVKAIPTRWDDNLLRRHGDTRIYDIGIREKETLEAQDAIIRRFVEASHAALHPGPLSSWEFNRQLGLWATANAPHPERSLTAVAAQLEVPIFWDSLSNHSIAMNLIRTDQEGVPVFLSAQKDILHSAAIAFYFANAMEDLGASTENNAFMDNIRELTYSLMILGAIILVSMTLQATLIEIAAGEMTMALKTDWFKALLRQDVAYYDIMDVSGEATM